MEPLAECPDSIHSLVCVISKLSHNWSLWVAASQAAEKVALVILSEAKNLSVDWI
jgi:hypothetical protein